MNRLFLSFFFLLFAACSGRGAVGECQDNADCNNQACIDNECEDVECLSSTDCQLNQFCDPKQYVCRDGCAEDQDCLAGESCNTNNHSCELYGCRETALDCEIGQFCNTSSGECFNDSQSRCQSCTEANHTDDYLNVVLFGEQLTDRHCAPWSETEFFWLKICNPNGGDDECPRGFFCVDNIYDDVTFNVAACIGDCPFYVDNGYLP